MFFCTSIASAELVAFIEEFLREESVALVFKLSKLADMCKTHLQQLGADTTYMIHHQKMPFHAENAFSCRKEEARKTLPPTLESHNIQDVQCMRLIASLNRALFCQHKLSNPADWDRKKSPTGGNHFKLLFQKQQKQAMIIFWMQQGVSIKSCLNLIPSCIS